jgi:sarcosine oxidase
MSERYDVAVIGLGAMGAHAVAELAARGQRVIGIERFGPLHERGSSHGDSRIIRLAYYEDPAYVPLLRRAYAKWALLEQRSRETLLTPTGILQIGPPDGMLIDGVRRASAEYDIAHEVLDPADARRHFPTLTVGADEVAVFEAAGAYLRPERAIAVALKLADADGAILHFNERVLAFEPGDGGVEVTTDRGRYSAGKVIVAAGSYVAGLLPEIAPYAMPIKQVVGWFDAMPPAAEALRGMPVFIVDEGGGMSFFGFPDLGRGVKIGKHAHLMTPIDPERPNPPVTAEDRELLADFMRRRMPGVDPAGNAFVTCRYTMLPEGHFLIDFVPGQSDIIVASPCSGHGFKFASVVGEILADLAMEGTTDLPIGLFSFDAMRRRAAAGA